MVKDLLIALIGIQIKILVLEGPGGEKNLSRKALCYLCVIEKSFNMNTHYAILKEKNVRIELVKMDGKEECNRTVKVEQSDI